MLVEGVAGIQHGPVLISIVQHKISLFFHDSGKGMLSVQNQPKLNVPASGIPSTTGTWAGLFPLASQSHR